MVKGKSIDEDFREQVIQSVSRQSSVVSRQSSVVSRQSSVFQLRYLKRRLIEKAN